jgi:hypothetical protein
MKPPSTGLPKKAVQIEEPKPVQVKITAVITPNQDQKNPSLSKTESGLASFRRKT